MDGMTGIPRRDLLRKGAALGLALLTVDALAACAATPAATTASSSPTPRPSPTPTPLPAPETATVRLAAGVCDAPVMASERFLREEGFTDIQISDAAGLPGLTGGKVDLATVFMTQLANAVDTGKPVVGVAGIHAGCAEVWAQRSIASLNDLRGRTIAVPATTADNIAYVFLAIALKNAGIDPKEVNFVIDANPTKAYLDGKSDALVSATTGAVALHANPANKGHVILDQSMAKPWSEQDCCILVANADWLRANPIAATRAVRAVMRAADSLGDDRAETVKQMTDKGLFGGAKNYDAARAAANMVSLDWRALDPARSLRFHGGLMAQVGLMKTPADEIATKGTDTAAFQELKVVLKK